MPSYTVEWAIDIEADTPEEAAREARRYQREGVWGGVFDVAGENGDVTRIDLDELDSTEARDDEDFMETGNNDDEDDGA